MRDRSHYEPGNKKDEAEVLNAPHFEEPEHVLPLKYKKEVSIRADYSFGTISENERQVYEMNYNHFIHTMAEMITKYAPEIAD